MKKNKTVSRIVSLVLTMCMLLSVIYLPTDVFAAPVYGTTTLMNEDFMDASDWTLQSGITHVPSSNAKHLKLTNASATTSAYYNFAETANAELTTNSKPSASNLHITFDAKVNGPRFNITSCVALWDGGASRYYTLRIYNGKVYGTTKTGDVELGTLPAGFDISVWHTYTIRWHTGGGYFIRLLIDGTEVTLTDPDTSAQPQGTSDAAHRVQFFADQAAGTVEIDNVKVTDVALSNAVKLEDNFDSDSGKWASELSTDCTAELVNTNANNTGFLRLTRTATTGRTIYANGPTYAEPPADQKVEISFDADLTGGGEVGFLFDAIKSANDANNDNKALRRLYFSLRPASATRPAGFYKRSGEGDVKIDLTNVDIDGWHTYSFTVDPVAETAEVFVDGTKVGTLALEAASYKSGGVARPTATHAQFMMLNLENVGEEMLGYADVDNLKIQYTMWGPAPEFSAASVVSITDTTADGFKATWPAAENATAYDVYLDGVLKAENVTDTSYTFSGLTEKAEGYAVKIVAKSVDNPNETDDLTITAWVGDASNAENFESTFGKKVLYDDYIDLSKAPYSIGDAGVGIIDQLPTSNAVGTTTKDAAVLAYDAATKTLHAVGVGTAKLIIGGTYYNVKVEPAPISLFMITGHSQGAGSKGDAAQSIVCEQGQVYSSHESEAVRNVRDFATAGTLNPAEQTLTLHSPAELAAMGIGTAAASRPNGIDALTAAGNGTPAADSGFAYQWNKLTGEKVWILNCAVGGSNQDFWMPDQDEFWAEYNADPNNIPRDQLDLSVNEQHYINMYGTMYQHSVDLFRAAQTVLVNEIAAGHFTLSHMGLLNFTGANGDEWTDPAEATAKFNTMWNAYKTDLSMDMTGDGTPETVESIGVMPLYHLRSMENQTPSDFLNYTKAVNHHMAASNDYPHVYLTALDHRQWLTNDSIATYFANYDLSYTIQSGNAITRPTTINDIFPIAKNDVVHYQQVAYNTLGQEMAKRTKMYFAGEKGADTLQLVTACQTPGAAEVVDLTTMSPIQLSLGQEYKFGILAAPGGLTVEASGAISLDVNEMGTIKAASTAGFGTLTVSDGNTVLETITFRVGNALLDGDVDVTMEGWTYGETAKSPAGITQMTGGSWTYKYSGTLANGAAYAETDVVPTEPGTYTVTATYANSTHSGSDTANFTIAKKQLTIGGLSVVTKAADGTTDAKIKGTATLVGLVGSDNVTHNYAVSGAAFADAEIGKNKAVTVTLTGAISGNDAWKYEAPATTLNLTGEIGSEPAKTGDPAIMNMFVVLLPVISLAAVAVLLKKKELF